MSNIYKICDADLWDSAEKSGRLHFAGRKGLRLITVDASVLDIRWEPARSGDLFPHLYADLPLSAVRSVKPLPLGNDGLHQLPSQL